MATALGKLKIDSSDRRLVWPVETKRWWATVATMPHCVLWTDADWQFAFDTALVAAAFHAGNTRLATELRNREKTMGTTVEARRDLRIRYRVTEPNEVADALADASITTMADYRRAVQ